MAGGTFDTNVIDPKKLPGTYINFESGREEQFEVQERGVVLLPLFNATYGPARKFISIDTSALSSVSQVIPSLGSRLFAPNYHMTLVRQALQGARKVLCYIPHEGVKASAKLGDTITVTAMYGGSRGNDLRVAVLANPVEGYDLEVYLDNERMEEFTRITSISQLIECGSEWVTFAGTGDLEEIAGVRLSGGMDGETTNADVMRFLDDSEAATWTTMAFPVDADPELASDAQEMKSIMDAVNSKITFLRDQCGRYRSAVVANYAANNENITNVTNGVVLSDGTRLPAASATAWVAGLNAGSSNKVSNTYKVYQDAVDIINPKASATEAEKSVARGEFFFVRDDAENVVIQSDINSLTDFKKPRDKSYSINVVMRVFDTFAEAVQARLRPVRFDNTPDGYDLVQGEGQALLHEFEQDKVIKNVDPANDFIVNLDKSADNYVYIDARLQPSMLLEKFYLSIRTF